MITAISIEYDQDFNCDGCSQARANTELDINGTMIYLCENCKLTVIESLEDVGDE
jgi:hypothetical protein